MLYCRIQKDNNVNFLVGMVMVTAGVSRYGVTVGTNIKPGASHRDPAIRSGMGPTEG